MMAAVVGVILLVGLIALFLSATVWRVPMILVVFCVMAAGLTFFYLSARTLKTHAAWRKDIATFETRFDEAEKKNKELADGPQGVREIKADLKIAMAGRGNIWRGATATTLDPGTNTLTVTLGADETTAPPEVNHAIFAFDEAPVDQGGAYVGEFLVTEVAARTVTLTPQAGMTEEQLGVLEERPRGTWILFEVMPYDRHDLFATVEAATLKKSLPAESVDEYLKDGKPADTKDPAGRRWARVEFLKDYEGTLNNGDMIKFIKPTDVQLGEEKPVTYATGQTAIFDDETRARLIQDQSAEQDTVAVKFEPGDTAVVDPLTAAALVKSGAAKLGERVYVRELRNYPRLFRDLKNRQEELLDIVERIEAETAEVGAATKKVEDDIAYRENEIAELKKDLAKFQGEVKAVAALYQQIDKRYREVTAQLNATFAENNRLAAELRTLQTEALQKVNERTGESPAGTRLPSKVASY